MSLEFITVIDMSSEFFGGKHRTTTLAISDKESPKKMWIMGVLPHNTQIGFDKENAQKLIDYLQENVINKE